MSPEKVSFTAEKETMLLTLFGKAMHSRTQNPVLKDPWAEEAISRIDYDFGKFKIGATEMLVMAIRSKNFDVLTAKYLADHPNAIVLHLGCGMDCRVFRIDPPPGVRWFDVDYPEVIDLRRRLYPERDSYQLVGSSLADLGWLNDVPADQPAMVVAEGVMMYLTEEIVRPLLNRLSGHFTSGQLLFDGLNWRSVRMTQRASVHGTGATYHWGIDDPADLSKLDPHFELVKEFRTSELAEYSRLPWALRAVASAMDAFPGTRRMNRLLLYRFD